MLSDVKSIIPTDYPSIGAPWLVSSIAATLTRARVANSIPPYANVLISNVPGPNLPLYFAGAKQISTYPVSIPYHGLGLNITLQSYNGWLDFGLISCQKLMPDIYELAAHMKEAHQELLELSLKNVEESTKAIADKGNENKGAGNSAKAANVKQPAVKEKK